MISMSFTVMSVKDITIDDRIPLSLINNLMSSGAKQNNFIQSVKDITGKSYPDAAEAINSLHSLSDIEIECILKDFGKKN